MAINPHKNTNLVSIGDLKQVEMCTLYIVRNRKIWWNPIMVIDLVGMNIINIIESLHNAKYWKFHKRKREKRATSAICHGWQRLSANHVNWINGSAPADDIHSPVFISSPRCIFMLVDSHSGWISAATFPFSRVFYFVWFQWLTASHASTATRNHKPNHAELVLSMLEGMVIRNYGATTAILVAAAT